MTTYLGVDYREDTGHIRRGDATTRLTKSEHFLFGILLHRQGGIAPIDYMADALSSERNYAPALSERTVSVHLCRLRKKLLPLGLAINVERGFGYALAEINGVTK